MKAYALLNAWSYINKIVVVCSSGTTLGILETEHEEYAAARNAMQALFSFTVGVREMDYRELSAGLVLLCAVFPLIAASVIPLLNWLTAQLNCLCRCVCAVMVGFGPHASCIFVR